MRYALLVLLAVLSSEANAQELLIGSIRLSIGMEQAAVMRELRSRFEIIPVTAQAETFFVFEHKAPKSEAIGGVGFRNGRLSWIQRCWGSFQGRVDSVAVSKAVFAALESAATSSGGAAVVSTKIQRVPGVEFRTITFEFPSHRVTVLTSEGDSEHGGDQVEIEESVRAPK